MKQYLSLALIASAVFGTGCASCRDKCPFSCLSSCCSKTACAKPKVEFVAQKPASPPDAKTTAVSDAEKIAQEIAASSLLEQEPQTPAANPETTPEPVPVALAKSQVTTEATTQEKASPTQEKEPTTTPELAEASTETRDSADSESITTATTEADPSVNSFVPPPPPARVSLSHGPDAESLETEIAQGEPARTEAEESVPQNSTFPGMVPVEALSSPEATPSDLASTTSQDSEELFDHHKDYMWVQGKMIHIYSRGGYWQVRYASYDESDEYGGKFILVGTVPESIKEGDFVRIRGKVLEENRWLSGTEYRIDSIQVLDTAATPVAN